MSINWSINKTELIELCRKMGLGNVSREMTVHDLCQVLDEEKDPTSCPLEKRREIMEEHIEKNFRSLRTQLPGCTGKCVSYGCPDAIVIRCYDGFKDDIL